MTLKCVIADGNNTAVLGTLPPVGNEFLQLEILKYYVRQYEISWINA